ncbi:ATP-binding cassette domain-containing protein [Ruficoccus amylovorans]|uniref:ATP-binding cassette domain-containing protein n=1 Tax=Ruficoccus amylovorans TaxID=1804625 RepID=A0A842HDY0_9BACT|nr:ATP-binding cassette domain-containing protein [Ruficoccus amylovorans]MBC2594765.1 ATP-binding cassette domain-containing protein [Ruficoccus amylovorans]
MSTEPTPLLSVEGLAVMRGDTHILRRIDWRVERGQHWAILGANGCGKTSLLSAITAYLTPSSGEIVFDGDAYGETDWNEVRLRIGIVSNALTRRIPPGEDALNTVLSGGTAQLGFWTRSKSIPTDKALRCLGKLGVRHLAERRWEVLSQGERQKVFIARALMADPRLLILDEPCAGLDPVAREHFLTRLRKLAALKNGPAMILVTHHVEEIFPEISHVLVLRKGRVLAAGPVGEALSSETLSQAFGAPLALERDRQGRLRLVV